MSVLPTKIFASGYQLSGARHCYLSPSYLLFTLSEINKVEFTIWILVWLGFLVVTLTPTSFNFVMDAFSFDSMLDVVIVTSIMVIYIICFRNYVVGRRLEKKLEELVRNDAINTMITKDD